ncbi:MAG: TonB C-terminal domain-containing protein, partial [Myxococcota bacterium]|nr:TonB C-terminal domain-containing protein [Myxococcota bacterium]
MRALALLIGLAGASAGCGDRATAQATPVLAPSGPRLPPPAPVDLAVRGAAYLRSAAAQIQPRWEQFLEDCRLRLPKAHPLNQPTLASVVELAVQRDGTLADVRLVTGSGTGDFDVAVFDVLADVTLPPPPAALESDDELVHLRWQFARDRRQAGPATAQVVLVELPLLVTVERALAQDQLERAARRVVRSRADDPDRLVAAERVMIAVLRAALASSDGAV